MLKVAAFIIAEKARARGKVIWVPGSPFGGSPGRRDQRCSFRSCAHLLKHVMHCVQCAELVTARRVRLDLEIYIDFYEFLPIEQLTPCASQDSARGFWGKDGLW